MSTLKINQIVFTTQHGEGIIKSINGTKAVVDFNGVEKTMLTMVLKTKAPKAKKVVKEESESVDTFNSVVNGIKGDRTSRGSMFAFSSDSIYNKIERLADSQNHFAGKIIEDARNGKFISDKQACVVAYFAKNNGLIK